MSTYTTLNPLDKAFINLSGGNLVFTASSFGSGGVRAITGQTTGKHYFECLYSNVVGSDSGVGLSRSTATFGNLQSNAAGGVIAFHGFTIYNNGTSTGVNPGALNSGTTMGVAVDLDASLVWFTVDGTHWNSTSSGTNNPATGVGGMSISGITGALLYPTILAQATGETGTLNFGDSSFTFSLPSGFDGWPAPPPVPQQPTRIYIDRIVNNIYRYEDPTVDDGMSNVERLRRVKQDWSIGIPRVAVAKAINYDILTTPVGESVAKAIQYDILIPLFVSVSKATLYVIMTAPGGIAVSKFIEYVVLETVIPQGTKHRNPNQSKHNRNFAPMARSLRARRLGSPLSVPGTQIFVIT